MLKTLVSGKLPTTFCTFCALIALATPAAAVPTNVTLGKAVTITGEVGVISPVGAGFGFGDATAFPPATLSTVVDGAYLPEGTYWQSGTVWWDENHPGSVDNVIEIDLGGWFQISFISIQADNNDNYAIQRRDHDGVWHPWLTAFPFGDAGMRERAGAFDIDATAIRIDAFGGDLFYAVSELRLMGEALPEPGILALFGLGLAGFGFSRRKKA